MGTYVAKLQIGNDSNNLVAFGDILYGTCSSAADAAKKEVTLANLDQPLHGLQIRVKFTAGNSATSGVYLNFPGTSINDYYVQGDCVCSADSIISFTYVNEDGGVHYWRVTSGGVSQAIRDYVSGVTSGAISAVDSMVFKGTLGTGGTITTVPDGSSGHTYKIGETYRIITAGTYAGQVCEVGDLLIAVANSASGQSSVNSAHWTVAQTNIDGAVIGPAADNNLGNHVAIFDGTTGKLIKDSGFTLGKSVPSDAVFTDTDTNTSYQYTLTNGTTGAFTACDAMGTSDTTGTVLVSVNNGVLKLEKGIKFTTTTYSLSESAVAGPVLS